MFEKEFYVRLLMSDIAEDILSKSNIYTDKSILNSEHLKRKLLSGVDKSSDLYKFTKASNKNGGWISTKYFSKDKVTHRMFCKKGHLNLITLSDPSVMSSIVSRYDDGFIVEIDYSQFEPTIMQNLIGYNFPGDVHDLVSDALEIGRDDAKKINNAYFYGMAKNSVFNLAIELSAYPDKYFELMKGFEEAKNEFLIPHVDMFRSEGYVVNNYGRKIYPRIESNIFNNVIQSTGSDILIDVVISLNKKLENKKAHLLFHRFDSIFLDLSKECLHTDLKSIMDIMENINPDVRFETKVHIGKNMNDLKLLE